MPNPTFLHHPCYCCCLVHMVVACVVGVGGVGVLVAREEDKKQEERALDFLHSSAEF